MSRDFYSITEFSKHLNINDDDVLHQIERGYLTASIRIYSLDSLVITNNGEDSISKAINSKPNGVYDLNEYDARTICMGESVMIDEVEFNDLTFKINPAISAGLRDIVIRSENEVILKDKPPIGSDRAHISNNLTILIQAANKFWANACQDDNSTHPINSHVAAWLIDRGYSQTLAEKGATIIRPEWATTGRKAEK